jgi:hypothetical protein
MRAPRYDIDDARRQKDAEAVFREAAHDLIQQAIECGWGETEAALSLADEIDDYVLGIFIVSRFRQPPLAANCN